MTTHKKPVWRSLAVVGLLGGAGLTITARLPKIRALAAA